MYGKGIYQDGFVSFAGSLLANLNHNNLKYGTEISRTSSFMQGATTPLTASPNKNLGPEKIILLVCNRACSGHQGKRYGYLNIMLRETHDLFICQFLFYFKFIINLF